MPKSKAISKQSKAKYKKNPTLQAYACAAKEWNAGQSKFRLLNTKDKKCKAIIEECKKKKGAK